jgi:hypothetical protein
MRAYKRFLLASVALVALGGQEGLAADPIGTAAAVKNRATGTLGAQTRALKAGLGVFKNERVDTARDASAQLIFSDETALTIGPNSSVTLDEFVYDPSKNAGKAVIKATKGAFRFISGSVDPRSYRIKTPVGTMGVRGTIVDFFFLPTGALVIILVKGALAFTVDGSPPRTHRLTKAGQSLIIYPDRSTVGPEPWDGTINGVLARSNIPLFGSPRIMTATGQWDVPYSVRDINTAINGETPSPYQSSGYVCWVARAVYGADNPNWLLFRAWLLEDAPTWLRSLYIRYGERLARWIEPHPRLTAPVRSWMDARIAGRLNRRSRGL